jgi:hypothetical protein
MGQYAQSKNVPLAKPQSRQAAWRSSQAAPAFYWE